MHGKKKLVVKINGKMSNSKEDRKYKKVKLTRTYLALLLGIKLEIQNT